MTPRAKFCGLSQLGDVAAMNAVHPDYVGFVFWPKSRRLVSSDEAHALRRALDGSIVSVGVFVDEDPRVVADLHACGVISVAQLHGDEDEGYLARLRDRAPGLEVWKAFEVSTASDVEAANGSGADLVLLDAGKGGGRAFDYSLLANAKRPFALAGGLGPDTIADALASLPVGIMPVMVDVSTGIEADRTDAAGRPSKDLEKMQRFMKNLRKC